MTDTTVVELVEDPIVVSVADDDVSVNTTEDAVVVEVDSEDLVLEISDDDTIVIELGIPGPPGLADPVWIIKPNATLSYDGDGFLIRVDYADGTYKDLTYTNGLLTQVQGENLDGETHLVNCMLGDVSNVDGVIERCLLSGTIVLSGAEPVRLVDCRSGVPGLATPVIDFNGSGSSLGVRNYNGGIRLINKNGADAVSIDMNSGQIQTEATVTQGTLVYRGVGKHTNNTIPQVGLTIDDSYLVQGADIATIKNVVAPLASLV